MIEPRQLPDHLLSQGRYTFTIEEACTLLDLNEDSASAALSRLRHEKKQLFSPTRGLYVLVPPEYRSWGVVPADWFVDEMFSRLGHPYYTALLSAAALHGASHQAPQVFQVMTPARLRARELGRVRLRFYRSEFFDTAETARANTPTGQLTISTKETTVVDLVERPRHGGGLDNVATIIGEIGPLNGSSLARLAGTRGLAIIRRVGWLVDRFGEVDDLEALRQAARPDQGEASPLGPSDGRRGRVDREWALRLNRPVEPDL